MEFAGYRYGAIVYFVVCLMFAHNLLNGSESEMAPEMGQSAGKFAFPRIDQINDAVLEKIVERLWQELIENVIQEKRQIIKKFEMGACSYPGNMEDLFALVLDKLLLKIDFSAIISPATEASMNIFRNILRTQIISAFIERYYKHRLSHCSCISTPKRIVLAIRMVNDILNKFAGADDAIVFTAFASGSLFQEYIVLKPLVDLGYTNIILNIIDLAYPDQILLQSLLTRTGKSTIDEALQQYRSDLINAIPDIDRNDLYISGENFASLNPDLYKLVKDAKAGNQRALDFVRNSLPQVTVNFFKNVKEYIVQSRKNPQIVSNVLSLVDPDLTLFRISAYPYESNLVGLTIPGLEGKYRPHVFITLPEEKPIQIYVQTSAYKFKEVRDLVEKILQIVQETGAYKKYTPLFRNKIIEKFSSYSLNALNKQLPKYQKLLMDDHVSVAQIGDMLEEFKGIIAPYRKPVGIDPAAKAYQKSTIKLLDNMLSYALLEGLDKEEKIKMAQIMINKILMVINTFEPAVTLSWFSDAHLAFQELVGAAKNDVLIYLYYATDLLDIEGAFVFEEVDKKSYLARDVFGPLVGKLLTEVGIFDNRNDHEAKQESSDDDSCKIVVIPEALYERVM